MLTFMDMLTAIEDGKLYKRDSWDNKEGYVSIPFGTTKIYKSVITNGQLNMAWQLFDLVDFKATDWREITKDDLIINITPPAPPANDPNTTPKAA